MSILAGFNRRSTYGFAFDKKIIPYSRINILITLHCLEDAHTEKYITKWIYMFVPKLYQNFKPKQWNLLKILDTYSDRHWKMYAKHKTCSHPDPISVALLFKKTSCRMSGFYGYVYVSMVSPFSGEFPGLLSVLSVPLCRIPTHRRFAR